MTRPQLLAIAAVVFVAVAATTWPFRSERLISWDAANFAFALEKIDIGAHRPHPPGYLGYVFAGRALQPLFHDANAALTAWNVLVRSAAVVLIVLLTWSATRGSMRAALAAGAILLTSPLLWFYASNAEIYPSEMTLALAVVYAASESLNGRRGAIYWAVGLLAFTALFKISAVVLLGPAVLYAWSRSETGTLWRSAALFAVIFFSIELLLFVIQPDFLQLLVRQFSGFSPPSRINRNIRDLLTNLLAALGIVNAGAFLAWAIVERRLPPAIDRRLVVLWTLSWLLLLVFVHIGNPGYVLPLLPAACLVLGAWYARYRTPAFVALVVLQAVTNLAHVARLAPPIRTAEATRYRDKSLVRRIASDLEPLSFPTLAYVRRSDAAVNRLRAVASDCAPGSSWVVVASLEPVDWRRTTYYLRNATTVRLKVDGLPEQVGREDNYALVREEPLSIASRCGLLWMSVAPSVNGLPPGGRHLEGFGWVFPAGAGHVSAGGITWIPD